MVTMMGADHAEAPVRLLIFVKSVTPAALTWSGVTARRIAGMRWARADAHPTIRQPPRILPAGLTKIA